jgi:N-acetylglucosaminyl-diphospho-decaprenol L-rhamnosyltransferase
MDTRPLFSLIIINFNSAQSLPGCLSSLRKTGLKAEDLEVIVVNNDTDEHDALDALRKQHEFSLIDAPENLGFGKANNLGARSARGDFLFFLNPDSRILSGSLADAAGYLRENPSFGILGCRLVTKDGSLQEWSAGTEVTLWDLVRNNLGLPRSKALWESARPLPAAWVSGAAMLMPRSLFEALGGFDESFFLYFEDVDLCRRANAFGREAVYFPHIDVEHRGGASSRSRKAQKRSFYASQDLYFRKHRPVWEGFMVRWLRRLTHF